MANRFPLILNKTTKQIEELSSEDDLEITGCKIIGATDAEFTGTVECTEILLNGESVVDLISGDWNTLDNKPTALSQFTNDVGFITEDTDSQDLGLIGSTLSIERGNSIDLSSLFQLQVVGNNISIVGGNTVALPTPQTLFYNTETGQLSISDGNTVTISGGGGGPSTDTLDDVLGRGNVSLFPITVGAVNTGELYITGTGSYEITSANNLILNAADGVGDIVATGSKIINVGNPVADTDAATKGYVDQRSNENWLRFSGATSEVTSNNVTSGSWLLEDDNTTPIEVGITIGIYSSAIITMNISVENAVNINNPSEFELMRIVNGALPGTQVKTFVQEATGSNPGSGHYTFLDFHGASEGDVVTYRLRNNMADNYSGEDLRLRFGVCGDTIGVRAT